jgi:hypothetical protein
MVGNYFERWWNRIAAVIRSVGSADFRRLLPGAECGPDAVSVAGTIILCYTCRRRVSPEELAGGLHNHRELAPQTSSVQLASSDVIHPEVRPD